MNLGAIHKRRERLRQWQRSLDAIRAEMETEYPDDRLLMIAFVSNAAAECLREERLLLRAAQERLSSRNRATCRVQSAEEP